MADTCRQTIDSLRNDRCRGKGNRAWWTRSCKRTVIPGSDYCWQHQSSLSHLSPSDAQPEPAEGTIRPDGDTV